jgi:hypothetical protein
MSNAEPPQKRSKRILSDKDPVVALLVEISGSLKELNSTLKDHTTRLARLEGQKPSGESDLKENNVGVTSGEKSSISDRHSSDGVPVSPKYADMEPKGKTELQEMRAESQSAEGGKSPTRGVRTIEVKHGEMPPLELFHDARKKKILLGYNNDFTSWLKEKKLLFGYDGRQSLPFDIVSLAHSPNLEEAQRKVREMEEFYRNLKESGGLFLIRESVENLLWSRIWDGSRFALFEDEGVVRFQFVEAAIRYGFEFPQPPTSYQTNEDCWSMWKGCYNDWLVTAPFRRLWRVLRIPFKIAPLAESGQCLRRTFRII